MNESERRNKTRKNKKNIKSIYIQNIYIRIQFECRTSLFIYFFLKKHTLID